MPPESEHEPEPIGGGSTADPDRLNVPDEGQTSALSELGEPELGIREPWEPPAGAEPKPPASAPRESRLDWISERLRMHVDAAIERFEVEGMTPAQENATLERPQSGEMYRGSRIDEFAKASIMNDPDLAEVITAPDFVAEPDILDSVMPDWFDITTPAAWQAHVVKYGPRFGAGHPVPTR